MSGKAIEVDELSVGYGDAPVLWHVGFSIPIGVRVGIIGPNGAGKSSLLKALMGVVKPLTGSVRIFGQRLAKTKQRIAYIPQRSAVDWDFPATVFDVVLMGTYGKLGFFRWPGKEEKRLAHLALEKVGMDGYSDRQISELSGGQQQRVFFARALAQGADLYCMDEPFAGIDMATEKALAALLEELKNQGKTLLVVHHDLSTVSRYYDWVMLLNTCLIGCGETKKVFTPDNIQRAYGQSAHLLMDAKKLSATQSSGLTE